MSGVGDYRYVDCVAIRAGKQEALEYIRALFNIPLSHCMAAGDSGNDILMLEGMGTVLQFRHSWNIVSATGQWIFSATGQWIFSATGQWW